MDQSVVSHLWIQNALHGVVVWQVLWDATQMQYWPVLNSSPLCNCCIMPLGHVARLEHLQASLCDHHSIVNAESLICSKQLCSSLITHGLHHFLQTHIAANATNNENFLWPTVSHGSLCNSQVQASGIPYLTTLIFHMSSDWQMEKVDWTLFYLFWYFMMLYRLLIFFNPESYKWLDALSTTLLSTVRRKGYKWGMRTCWHVLSLIFPQDILVYSCYPTVSSTYKQCLSRN